MFDLKQIKKDLERIYNVEFTEDKYLDSIKLPRRTTPKEDYEQISLF